MHDAAAGNPFEGAPVILHYDGNGFEPAAIPAGPEHALFKVWGIDGRIFAVGQQGLILGYDADSTSWTRHDAGPEADADFVSLWGSAADRIVAVGGRSGARIALFDGDRWVTRAPSAFAGLNGVHMERDDEAIIAGIFELGFTSTKPVENWSPSPIRISRFRGCRC